MDRRAPWAFVALAGTVLIKFITILLFPFFLVYAWNQRRGDPARIQRAAIDLVAFAAPLVLITLPFAGGQDTFALGRRFLMFTTSLPTAVLAVAGHGLETVQAAALTQGIVLGTLISVCGYYIVRLHKNSRSIETVSFDVLWAYLALACTWFQPWYLIWLIGLAALFTDPRRATRVHLFVFMGFISYFIFGFIWPHLLHQGITLLTFRALAGAVVMLPQIGLWAWQSRTRTPNRAARGHADSPSPPSAFTARER